MHPLVRSVTQTMPSFHNRLFTTMINQKERILIVVLGAIACIIASYAISRLLFKDKFNKLDAEENKIEKPKDTEQSTVSNTEELVNDVDEYGTLNGKGSRVYADGVSAKGDFIDGALIQGTITLPKGTIWTGHFVNGLLEGEGSKKWFDETSETGTFKNGKLNGKGERIFLDGTQESGNFEDGELHGPGGFRKYSDGIEENGTFDHGDFILETTE